jgi:flagellar hook assembly protein FlgD
MLGQRVLTLVDAKQTAGVHTVRWNGLDEAGRRVASGIYIYKIQAGDFVDNKKMLLLK